VLIAGRSTPRPWPDRRRPGGSDRHRLDAEARPGSSPRWRFCSPAARRRGAARIVAVLAVLIASRSTPRPWPDRRRAGGADRQRLDAEAVALIVAALAVLIASGSTPRPWR
jgi:hypothetical protein